MKFFTFKKYIVYFSIVIILSCTADDFSLNYNTSSNPNEITTSEAAVSAISGIVGGISPDILLASNKKDNKFLNIFDNLTNYSVAHAQGLICPSLSTSDAACNDNVTLQFDYFNCQASSVGGGIWNGGLYMNYSVGACSLTPVSDGFVTFTRNYVIGTYRLSPNGAKLLFDSLNAYGYDFPVAGGAIMSVGAPYNITITINGIDVRAIDSNSRPIWEHSISSTALSLSVDSSTGIKTMASGTITVQQNLEKFMGVVTLNNLIWTPPCNFPTSGTLNTTLSGSQVGTEVITFSSTCGVVTLVKGGKTKKFQLVDVY